MASEDTVIRLKTVADVSGSVQTRAEYEKTLAAARKLGRETAKTGGEMSKALQGVSSKVGLLRSALGGLGIAGAFAGLVASVERIRESFGKAKEEAEAFAEKKAEAARAEAVERLAKSYAALRESIAAAGEAAAHHDEIMDQGVKNARDLEDAQLALAEQKELAGVDDSDPLAAETRAEIKARYDERRGRLSATRSKDDVMFQRQKLGSQAEAARSAADALEASLAGDDEVMAAARGRLAEAQGKATLTNRFDATTFGAKVAKNLKDVLSLNWGAVGDVETERGNAVRAKAAEKAKSIEAEIKRIEEARAAKEKEIAAKRLEAARLEEKRNALGGQYAAADARIETAGVAAGTARRAAEGATARKKDEIAARAAERERLAAGVAQGETTAANLRSRISYEEARAQRNADALSASQLAAFNAQNAYSTASRGGSRKEKAEAGAAMDAAVKSAEEAKYQAERTAAEINSTLTALKEQLRQVENALKRDKSRLATAKEEL